VPKVGQGGSRATCARERGRLAPGPQEGKEGKGTSDVHMFYASSSEGTRRWGEGEGGNGGGSIAWKGISASPVPTRGKDSHVLSDVGRLFHRSVKKKGKRWKESAPLCGG